MRSKYEVALFKAQSSFRKAALADTYIALELSTLLKNPEKAPDIAKKLDLNTDAVTRFLHALAALKLLQKTADGSFVVEEKADKYDNKSFFVLYKIIQMKIPDCLSESAKSYADLQKELGQEDLAAGALQLLLDQAVAYELLIKTADGHYTLPEETRSFLISESAEFIGPLLNHLNRIMFPMFSVKGLTGALKTGKSQWAEFFPGAGSSAFTLYKDEKETLQTFTNGLHQLNTRDNRVVVSKLPLKGVKKVLDVGGGSGSLSIELVAQSPEINCVNIYELPEAIPILQTVFDKYAPNEKRIHFLPGSFFANTASGHLQGLQDDDLYDLILLAWILHDWTDETCLGLLKKVVMHLKPDGKLVVVEAILPEDRIGDAALADITMLLQTEGKERTFAEFKALLQQAGLKQIELEPTETRRQAIVARR